MCFTGQPHRKKNSIYQFFQTNVTILYPLRIPTWFVIYCSLMTAEWSQLKIRLHVFHWSTIPQRNSIYQLFQTNIIILYPLRIPTWSIIYCSLMTKFEFLCSFLDWCSWKTFSQFQGFFWRVTYLSNLARKYNVKIAHCRVNSERAHRLILHLQHFEGERKKSKY